jgi:hypothetical protein
MADDLQPGDPRAMRLWDLGPNQAVFFRCECGRIAQFLPGALQRLHRIPSDTLVCDLKFRFKCRKCNGKEFEVTVEELRTS